MSLNFTKKIEKSLNQFLKVNTFAFIIIALPQGTQVARPMAGWSINSVIGLFLVTKGFFLFCNRNETA